MESLAIDMEPGPVRTAFFANVGGYVDNISNDDPSAELINRFNRRMAALGSGGRSAESVADVIREIAAEPSLALRYQSSEESRAIAAQKLVDPTSRSILGGSEDSLSRLSHDRRLVVSRSPCEAIRRIVRPARSHVGVMCR
jgi:hypothetical protein